MILTMYVAAEDGPDVDERVLGIAIEESLLAAELGYNPWFTEHHFRGPWQSNPTQFAAYLAPQIPADRYLGFGVLSTPFYHPVRLVETMNLLDQLMKGRTLFGLGSGFAGTEPTGFGLEPQYHASGQAARDVVNVMQRLWEYRTGDPEYAFEAGGHRGLIRRRVVPAPYRKKHPTIVRTASSEAAIVTAAQNGWPVFVGTSRNEMPLHEQLRTYRTVLAGAGHAQDVVDECLRWCTRDWICVVVADSDAEAHAGAALAREEHMALRRRYVEQFGPLHGPVVRQENGESIAAAFSRGNDMLDIIAGTPDAIAEQVQGLIDLGINHLLVRFMGEWTGETRRISEKSMRLFAREVMPRFAGIPPLRDPLALDLSAVS